jgi:hypothetical protein
LIACKDNPSADDNYAHLDFNVDSSLLSFPTYIDSTFSIRMPLDWLELSQELFDKAKSAIDNDTTSFFQLELLKAYISETKTSCAISKVKNESELFAYLDEDFLQKLKESTQCDDIQVLRFLLNGNKTTQYRIIGKNIVTFKLYLSVKSDFYQIDFFIPYLIYKGEISKIESSIGSIVRI